MIKYICVICCLMIGCNLFSQNIVKLYKDDTSYLILPNKENGYQYNLKDSLLDGVYVLFDVLRKDSLSREKNILLKGEFKNRLKEGKFESYAYVYDKTLELFKTTYKHFIHYKSNKKEGKELEYNIITLSEGRSYNIMIFYGEYLNGKKNGLFMFYDSGFPSKVILFENDLEKNVLMENKK